MQNLVREDSVDYIKRQSKANLEYVREYHRWIGSLSSSERSELSKLGIEKPQFSLHSGGYPGGICETAQLPNGTLVSDCSSPQDIPADQERLWDVLRRLICEVVDSPNPGLSVKCLAIASGFTSVVGGESFDRIGKQYGLSRAAISRRCVLLCRKLGLRPSAAMRPSAKAQSDSFKSAERKAGGRRGNYLSAVNRIAHWWRIRRAQPWNPAELAAAARDLAALFTLSERIQDDLIDLRAKILSGKVKE